MLIAVLVLALLGLWSLPALALGCYYAVTRIQALESGAEGVRMPLGRRPRWRCTVCGAHHWEPVAEGPVNGPGKPRPRGE